MSSQHQVDPGHETAIPHGDPVTARSPVHGEHIHLPSPTAYPIITALGFTLMVGGILTHYVLTILGVLLTVWGCVGWFRDVLPQEAHEEVSVKVQEIAVVTSRKSVARITVGPEHRSHLPVETFSVMAGFKGGIAGGIAMIIPALAYGLIAQHSIWYPVNLLGGAGVSTMTGLGSPSIQDLRTFHASMLGIAIVIQAITSTLVGLLYGAVLPLMPRHPILLGGLLAPLAWTALLFAALPTINPEMSAHINWPDFLISQIVFGVVAGWVVSRSQYYRTAQSLPFAMRLGMETAGMGPDDTEGKH